MKRVLLVGINWALMVGLVRNRARTLSIKLQCRNQILVLQRVVSMASAFVEFSQLEKGLPVNPSPADRGLVQQPTTSTGSTTLADVSISSASARRKSS